MTVSIPDDMDPADYDTQSGFKSAVYDEGGTGSWLTDMKLEIIWRKANDVDLKDHHEMLVAGLKDQEDSDE